MFVLPPSFMSLTHNLVTRLLGAPRANLIRATRTQWQEEARMRKSHRHGCAKARSLAGATGLKLHLGCGHVYKAGWVNVDFYAIPPCTPDLTLDLRQPLPLADGNCAMVYSEHFFEHIPYPEGAMANLLESRRVLASGGRLSIGVPDPRPVLIAYLDDMPSPYFDYFSNHSSVQRHLHTRMEAVNWLFRQGGEHHFIYDFPSLEKMLAQAGFHGAVRREFDPDLDSEPRRHGTLYVDAVKRD